MHMKIKKILNHNIVVAVDRKDRECVLTGRGIAFGKRAGDEIDPSQVEKTFITAEKGMAEKLSRILESIPPEYIRVGDEIINMAKADLDGSLNEKIYLTLIDHIYFAVERHREGIDIPNALSWEMRQYYAEEFRVGQKALEIIEKRLGVRLPEDEAAFIAFHFVNAGSTTGERNIPVQDSLRMIRDILDIVESELGVRFRPESHSYNRFTAHLKYFSLRVLRFGHPPEVKVDSANPIYRLRYEFPAEQGCVEKIADYVRKTYGHETNEEEQAYLLLHLHTLVVHS